MTNGREKSDPAMSCGEAGEQGRATGGGVGGAKGGGQGERRPEAHVPNTVSGSVSQNLDRVRQATRFAVRHPRQEPYAGKPHVRILCGGRAVMRVPTANGNGRLLEKVGMDLGLRRSRLGLAPRRFGALAASVWDRRDHANSQRDKSGPSAARLNLVRLGSGFAYAASLIGSTGFPESANAQHALDRLELEAANFFGAASIEASLAAQFVAGPGAGPHQAHLEAARSDDRSWRRPCLELLPAAGGRKRRPAIRLGYLAPRRRRRGPRLHDGGPLVSRSPPPDGAPAPRRLSR